MDRRIFVLLCFLFIFSTAEVFALGITPGRTTVDFVPGGIKTVDFQVLNTEAEEMDIVVLINGELNNSISVSEVSFHMGATENGKALSYTFTAPQSLSPGLHKAEIVALRLPGKSSTSEAFVGAAVGVATQLHVNVPYPGKFADASLNVIGPNAGGEVTFVIPVVSRGDLDLTRVRATMDILGTFNEKIETISTNEIEVKSGERGEVVATWDSKEANSGEYKVVATLIYDEDTLTLEREFSIGSRLLNLLQVEVNNFALGEIAKFELLVENKWSEMISNAYAQMQVFNDDKEVMADFKSATYDIPSLEKKLLVAFWDTAGVSQGTYDSSVFLNYGDQSARQELQLEVKSNEINVIGIGYVISSKSGGGTNNVTIILITAIVVLVVINALWFLVLRKKLLKRTKK
jgi:hypothetical protein